MSVIFRENAKVWFRCNLCGGYCSSIPDLRRHARSSHQDNIQSFRLPRDLPPGAKRGKVYYSPLPNTLPKQLPYSCHSFISKSTRDSNEPGPATNIQEKVVEPETVEPERVVVPPDGAQVSPEGPPVQSDRTPVQPEQASVQPEQVPDVPVQPEGTPIQPERTPVQPDRTPVQAERTHIQSEETTVQIEQTPIPSERVADPSEPVPVSESEYDIRIRKLSEILEVTSSDEDDRGTADLVPNALGKQKDENNEKDGNNTLPPPAASPPDSGIMLHDAGNESLEDLSPSPDPPPCLERLRPNTSQTSDVDAEANKQSSSVAASSIASSSAQKKFCCGMCKKFFNSESQLNFHAKKIHGPDQENIKRVSCGTCQKSFETESQLNFHVKKIHEQSKGAVKKVSCDLCSKNFDSESQLNFHRKKIHAKAREKIIMTIRRINDNNNFTVETLTSSNYEKQGSCSAVLPLRPTSPACSLTSDVTTMLPASRTNSSSVPPENDDGALQQHESSDPEIESEIGVTRKRKRMTIESSPSSAVNDTESDRNEKSNNNPPKKKKPRRRRPSKQADKAGSSSDEDAETVKRVPAPAVTNSECLPKLSTYDEELPTQKLRLSDSSSSEDLFIPIERVRKKKKRMKKKTTTRTLTQVKEEEEDTVSKVETKPKLCTTICRTCGIQCQNATALITHMEEFHNLKKKVHLVCGYCSKRYKQKQHFNRHIQIHLDEINLEKVKNEIENENT